jgi:hypothetical protein
MSPLEYLMDTPYECGPNDINVVAFTKAAAIIRGHDAVNEFLACDIWPLDKVWEFEVERWESPILMVVVLMSKVTAIIEQQETGVALREGWELLYSGAQILHDALAWSAQPCVRVIQHELSASPRTHRPRDKKMPSHGCGGATSAAEEDDLEAETKEDIAPLGGQDL